MQINVYDSALNLKEVINNNDSVKILNATHTEKLENFSETFTFTTTFSNNIKELNYVSFINSKKELKLFQISELEVDIIENTVTVNCEFMSLQLNNKIFEEYTAESPLGILDYFNMFLTDTIFKVRRNEVKDLKRTLKWDSEATALNRILSVANSFDVELSYSANFTNNNIDCVYIDILRKKGRDTNVTLNIDNDSISEFKKTVNAKVLRTAMIPKGKYLDSDTPPIVEIEKLNLIKNSTGFEGSLNWNIFNGKIKTFTEELPVLNKTISKSGFVLKERAEYKQSVNLEKNTEYTISYYYKSNGGRDNKVYIDLNNKAVFNPLFKNTNGEYIKATGTFNSGSNTTCKVGFWVADGSTTYVTDLMLSDSDNKKWSPHVDDNYESDVETKPQFPYVNISNIEYDDGEFRTKKGENKIYAYKANEKYRRNFSVINQGYLDDVFSYETENEEELFNRALNKLKTVSKPSVKYECQVNLLTERLNLQELNLGDYINIYDITSDNEIMLKARISEISTDLLNTENSKLALGNYYETSTNFAKSFNDLKNQLSKTAVAVESKQKVLVIENSKNDVFLNNKIEATLTAKVLQGILDISNLYNINDFEWFKYDKNNVLQQAWSYKNQAKNKVILDNTEDIDMFATYVVKIKNTDLEAKLKLSNIVTTIASETEPLNPKIGEHWLDISKEVAILYVYTENGWLNISEVNLAQEDLDKIKTDVENNLSEILESKENAIYKQATEPVNPANNAIWIDTSSEINIAYRFDSSLNQWIKLSISELEEIILENGETLAEVIIRIQQKITDDSILDTVIKSKDFDKILKELVDVDDLLNYMSVEDFDRLSDDMKLELIDKINDSLQNNTQIIMTQFEQLAEQFRLSIKNGGGVNHIRNSLGFAKDNFWTKANNNPFKNYVDTELKKLNLYSGFELRAEHYTKKQELSQKIPVAPFLKYTFSFIGKGLKDTNNAVVLKEIGNKTTEIYRTKERFTNGYEKFTFTFTTNADTRFLSVHLLFDSDVSSFFVSGLMLNIGTELEWQQHATEFYNTNTIIDLNGISVVSNINEIYTQITNESFEIYREVEGIVKKVLTVNSDLTVVDKLKVEKELFFGDIVMKRLETENTKGFGFFNLPK